MKIPIRYYFEEYSNIVMPLSDKAPDLGEEIGWVEEDLLERYNKAFLQWLELNVQMTLALRGGGEK